MKNCPCRNCKSKEVKPNYLEALGIILFIIGALVVGSLDYKVLVM